LLSPLGRPCLLPSPSRRSHPDGREPAHGHAGCRIFFAIILTRDATLANVLYSTRSIWSVAIAWFGGHLLGLRDHESGHAIMARRLCGANLLFVVVLIMLF